MTSSHRLGCGALTHIPMLVLAPYLSSCMYQLYQTPVIPVQDEESVHGSNGYQHEWDEAAEQPGLAAQVCSFQSSCTQTRAAPSSSAM